MNAYVRTTFPAVHPIIASHPRPLHILFHHHRILFYGDGDGAAELSHCDTHGICNM